MDDPIIKELWRIKDEVAREHGYDLDALAATLRNKEAEEEREVVDLHPTKPEPPGEA
jgi:hypothetical protein